MPRNIFSIGTKKGFTLVELLVAVFLFSVITTMIGAVFVYELDLQRRAFNLQQTEENAMFVMETVLKELRVSAISSEVEDSDCPSSPYESLDVVHPDFGAITYEFSGGNLNRNGVPLNSNTVSFANSGFCVSGALSGDGKQPRITVFADLRSVKTKSQSSMFIQTTVSPRELND